jgi:hypothetical protein
MGGGIVHVGLRIRAIREGQAERKRTEEESPWIGDCTATSKNIQSFFGKPRGTVVREVE